MGAPTPDNGELPSFAVVTDMTARQYAVAAGDVPAVTELLADVSDAVRARGRRVGYDLDAAVAAGKVTVRTTKRITCAIAQRFRTAPTGPQRTQETFGPFSRSFTPADVALYTRADELTDLGIPKAPPPRGRMGDDPALPDIVTGRSGPCSTLG